MGNAARARPRAPARDRRAAMGARVAHGGALLFLAVFLFVPLVAVFAEALRNGRGRLCRGDHAARSAQRDQAHPADGGDSGAAEPDFRTGGVVGDHAVRVSRQEPADDLDRSAVRGFAGHRGDDLRAAVRRAGMVRRLARRASHPDHFRGSGNRAGDHVRHFSVRRARADPADGSGGHRRGGGGADARRERLADVLSGHAAQREVGAALWRGDLQCARDGRVRRGFGGLGAHPRADQHDAAVR